MSTLTATTSRLMLDGLSRALDDLAGEDGVPAIRARTRIAMIRDDLLRIVVADVPVETVPVLAWAAE